MRTRILTRFGTPARSAGHFLVAALLAWLSTSSPFTPMETGLDPSWVLGVNLASQHGLRFGSDLLFTYGPLGYLLVPQPVGHHVALAMLAQVGMALLWCMLALQAGRRPFGWSRLVVAGVLILLVGPRPELQATARAVGLAAVTSVERGPVGLIAAALTAVLTVILGLAKVPLGLAGGSALATALAWQTFRLRQAALPLWISAALAGTISLGLSIYTEFGSAGGWLRWCRGSLELASGYSAAMSLDGARAELILAACGLAGYALWAMRQMRDFPHPDGGLALVGLIPVFLMFKHGFVRQDGHVMSFFAGFLLILCGLAMAARAARTFRRWVVLASVAALLYVAAAVTYGGLPTFARLLGQPSLALTRNLLDFTNTLATAEATSRDNLQRDILTDPALAQRIAAGVGVDAIPWSTALVPAHNARWRPAPVFQHYATFTPWLDQANADHYLGTPAAEVVLARFQTIDGRHVLWDSPATWRSLLRNYDLSHTLPGGHTLMLEKRPEPRPSRPREFARTSLQPAAWNAVPFSTLSLWAEIPLRYNVMGHLARWFFRVPPVYLTVSFSDGHTGTWRIIPALAGQGFFMSCLPRNESDLAQLFRQAADHRLVAFKFTGPGTRYLSFPDHVRWVADTPALDIQLAPVILPARRFHAQTGRLDGEGPGSARIAKPDRDQPGYLAFGHYRLLGPGAYVATFFMTATTHGERVPVTLDVVCNRGRQSLVRQTDRDLAAVHEAGLALPFELPALAEDVELRVYYHGTGQVSFTSAHLAEVAPSRRPSQRPDSP